MHHSSFWWHPGPPGKLSLFWWAPSTQQGPCGVIPSPMDQSRFLPGARAGNNVFTRADSMYETMLASCVACGAALSCSGLAVWPASDMNVPWEATQLVYWHEHICRGFPVSLWCWLSWWGCPIRLWHELVCRDHSSSLWHWLGWWHRPVGLWCLLGWWGHSISLWCLLDWWGCPSSL